jgi:phage host-nuclease inhibitor protein Gam
MDKQIYNNYLLKIATIRNKISVAEEAANKEILVITAALNKKLAPMKTELEVAEKALTSLCLANKKEDFEKQQKFPNGKISVQAKGKSTLVIPDEDFTKTQLKNLKIENSIRTIEEINKDVVMAMVKADEKMCPIIGVSIKEPEDKVHYDTFLDATSTGLK